MGLRKIMRGLFFVVTLFFNHAIVSSGPSKLPDKFPQCRLDDPNFNDCLFKAIEGALPILSKGIPSLHVLPCDPMKIERAVVEQGTNRPVNLKFVIMDALLTGVGNSILKTTTSRLADKEFDVELFSPFTTLSGDYQLDGKFTLLPLKGEGKFNMALVGHKTNLKFKATTTKKDGDTYWHVEYITISITEPKNFTVNFENLFNGNKVLGDSTNKALNDNWEGFWEELRPSMEATFGSVFTQVANIIFSKVPEKNIFL